MLKSKADVETWLDELAPGNKLQSQWTKATTHLVMTSISLSLKVPRGCKLFILLAPHYYVGGEQPGLCCANCDARVLQGFCDSGLNQAEAASDVGLHT